MPPEGGREFGADLLDQIIASGSLSEAARRLHFSYRRAWLLLELMNRMWPGPLVITTVGGHHGGGAKITELGQNVLRAYRDAQRTYFELLSAARDDGKAIWLVSDFVTLGSPLSAADVLVAKDDDDFRLRKAYRELPTSPPWLEKLDPPRFSFDMRRPSRSPHPR